MPQQFDFYNPAARFDPEARAASNQRAVQNLQNFARQRQDIRNEEVLNRSRELQAIQQGKIQSDISQIDSTLTMGEKLTQAAGIYSSYGDEQRASQALQGADRFQAAQLKEQKIQQFEDDGITRDMLAYTTRAASTIDNPELFRSDTKARIQKLKNEGRDFSDTQEMLDDFNNPDKGPEYVADYLDGLARESSVLLDIPYEGALDNAVRTANGDLVGISKATGEQVRIPAPEGMDFEKPQRIQAAAIIPGVGAQYVTEAGKLAFQELTPEEQETFDARTKVINLNKALAQGQAQGARSDAKGTAEQRLKFKEQAIVASETIPKLARLAELNESVTVGGFAAAQNALTDYFGTTPADVGEFRSLSRRLVLDSIKQLGANPTEQERAFLESLGPRIESGSQAVNKALIKRLEEESVRQLQRGLSIQKGEQVKIPTLEEVLGKTGNAQSATQAQGDESQTIQEGATIRNPTTGKRMRLVNGQWVEL